MIVILYQQKFGGTDFLLGRLESWLIQNNYVVMSERNAVIQGCEIDLVIMPTSEMRRAYELLKKGLKFKKILIWSMGHGAFKAAFYNDKFAYILKGSLKRVTDIFINMYACFLLRDGSLLFTDLVGLNYDLKGIDLSKYNVNELVLPIAINESPIVLSPKIDKVKLTVGWVGRISKDFKVLPLLKLLKDLKQIAHKKDNLLKLIIVGDGDGAGLVKEALPGIDYIEIEWIKEIDIKELSIFINQNIDILFAMGTSALDGANAYTPTVVVQPFSHANCEPQNGYRWIFDSKGFSLGEYPGLHIQPQQIDVELNAIFDDVDRFGLCELSEKSKTYSVNFLEKNVFSLIFTNRNIKEISKRVYLSLFLLSIFYKAKLKLKQILNKFKVIFR